MSVEVPRKRGRPHGGGNAGGKGAIPRVIGLFSAMAPGPVRFRPPPPLPPLKTAARGFLHSGIENEIRHAVRTLTGVESVLKRIEVGQPIIAQHDDVAIEPRGLNGHARALLGQTRYPVRPVNLILALAEPGAIFTAFAHPSRLAGSSRATVAVASP